MTADTIAAFHPCLGVFELGACAYDPAVPDQVYFSLGDAVAALAFTLTVQQLLRPIYRFRMRARFLTSTRLNGLILLGLVLAGVAAAAPFVPARSHDTPILYPFLWEVLAAGCFALGYALMIFAVAPPVQVRSFWLRQFARSAADFLSSADDQDRAEFAPDLARSLPLLVQSARSIERRGNPAAEAAISGKISKKGAWAWSILRIFADPALCGALIRRAPWKIARALQVLAEKKLHSVAAEPFVQELARQAVLSDESQLAREVAFNGFGEAPLLTASLFENHFIVSSFDPLGSLSPISDAEFRGPVIDRYNHAAEKCLMALIGASDDHNGRVLYSIKNFYESAFTRVWYDQAKGPMDAATSYALHSALDMVLRVAKAYLDQQDPRDLPTLFVDDPEPFRSDLLEILAAIVTDALGFIGNVYTDFTGGHWTTIHSAMQGVFPSIGAEPDGLDPFQQRVAILIRKKLQENMEGYYPALSVVLLATVGPYEHRAPQNNRTAFNILKDVVYLELRSLPALAERKPDKVTDFLPKNVTYDPAANTLSHQYRSGAPRVTALNTLVIEDVDLAARANRRQIEAATSAANA